MNLISNYLSRRLPFYYGYVVVLVAVLAQICTSPGQTFAISAFTPFLQESLGLSSSRLAAAYMLGTFLASLPLSLIGPFSDRYGLRITTVGVALGLSLACFLMSSASGFGTLLLGFLFLRFLGQGALTLLSSNLISMWFHRRLGRVNAAISLGSAAAFAAMPVILLASIRYFGWRWTYLAMGAGIGLTLAPLAWVLIRNRPEDVGRLADGLRPEDAESGIGGEFAASNMEANTAVDSERVGPAAGGISRVEFGLTLRQAAGHRTFWILATGMCLWAMIGTGIVFYALPIFEQFGIPQERSKLMFSTFSLSMLLAQVGGGILADRLAMNRLLAIGFTCLTAGAMMLPLTSSEGGMHLFAALFGTGQGMALAVSSTMWVRYYGRPNLGKIRGAVWCATVAGSGCGPFVLGLVDDYVGSFTPGLWCFAALLVPLGPLALWATPPQPEESERLLNGQLEESSPLMSESSALDAAVAGGESQKVEAASFSPVPVEAGAGSDGRSN